MAFPCAVRFFNGQALNIAQLYPSGPTLPRQQTFQHPAGLRQDDGADSITGNEADNDVLHFGKILGRLALLHPRLPLELLGQQLPKMGCCIIENCFVICHQSVPSFV